MTELYSVTILAVTIFVVAIVTSHYLKEMWSVGDINKGVCKFTSMIDFAKNICSLYAESSLFTIAVWIAVCFVFGWLGGDD